MLGVIHWILRLKTVLQFFQKLYTIAKRVTKLKPFDIWNRNALDWFAAAVNYFFAPAVEIGHEIRDVTLGFYSVDVVFSTKMNLKTVQLQPKAAAPDQRRRLWDFVKVEHAAVECPCLVLGSDRNTDLYVMDGFDHKGNLNAKSKSRRDAKVGKF